MTWLWILVPVLILLAAVGGGKQENAKQKKTATPHWIYHPHVIETDEYECSVCHARFPKESPLCPKCGTKMLGKTVTDENEWIDEEEELDIIFDDD
ncbi:MAG: hypothetical protein IJ719_12895 [Clostridia bacterium]|nr:hypothetical protein [Clostridia bacterium]